LTRAPAAPAVPLTAERARLTGSSSLSLSASLTYTLCALAGRAIVRAWNILHAAHQPSAESKKWVDGRQALRTLYQKPLHPPVCGMRILVSIEDAKNIFDIAAAAHRKNI
jgi:hypothetical protein